MDQKRHCVFITGGTGYLGHPLLVELLRRGHDVRAMVRAGSEGKLPPGCKVVVGNALDGASTAITTGSGPRFRNAIPSTSVRTSGKPNVQNIAAGSR